MKRFSLVVLFVIAMIPLAFAEDLDPKTILNETSSVYKDMQSYWSNVSVDYNSTISGQPHKSSTTGILKLLKPNFYYVQWLSKSGGEGMEMKTRGVIWNFGNGDYMYTGYSYAKHQSEEINFGAGAGISSSVTQTIPSLFFQEKGDILSAISDSAKLIGSEAVNGEDCYVLEASTSFSPKVTLWISKSRKLLVKLDQAIDTKNTKTEIPEYTDEQVKESLTAMGQDPTPENMEGFKRMMALTKDKMKEIDMQGTISQTFLDIQMNPAIEQASLEYTVPSGVTLQENPYKDMFDPKKLEALEKVNIK